MTQTDVKLRRQKRNRIGMAVVLIIILAGILSLLPYIRQVGTERQQQGKQSFAEYVLAHHLGKLTLIDTGTGIDPVSDVLTIASNIPDAKRKAFVLSVMKRYVEDDHGQTLSVEYVNPQKEKHIPIGFANYDDDTHRLQVNITHQNGQVESFSEKVDW